MEKKSKKKIKNPALVGKNGFGVVRALKCACA